MYPYLISLTSCACQFLHACPAYSQSAHCNQCERFFLFHFRSAWLICQCLTQWRVNTYSTQPCQHCLWPSGKIINHPKSQPAFVPSPLSHSTFLHSSYFAHSSVFGKHHLSLTLSFRCLATHSPSQPLPFAHTRTHTCTRTVHFHKTVSHIPRPWHHSP